MTFMLEIVPPTVTAQQKGECVVGGRVHHYEKRRVTEARTTLTNELRKHAPAEPMTGPIRLMVDWIFPTKSHRDGEWRITRPDTDNLQKLLKDCMTSAGFWADDSQVCVEIASKRWARGRAGIVITVDRPLAVWKEGATP